MRIEIVTMWYNEAFLAPFFISHYKYVDKINILFDSDTDDETCNILDHVDNVEIGIDEFTFPDGMDDEIKRDRINIAIKKVDADWIYVLDADEFIFPPGFENPCTFLSRQSESVVIAKMWQVYRHINDIALDSGNEPIITQRSHGDSNRETGINAMYCKPIIIQPPVTFELSCGNHSLIGNYSISSETYDGTHWAMADPIFVINRRIQNRKERQSQRNLDTGMTYHQHDITENSLLEECELHNHDPKLF